MKPLEEIQREFFAALQLPLRGTSRRSTELPPTDEGHSPDFLATADRLMKPTASLSSAERLELYHRQYWFRVLDSVAEDFPVLRRMAGEEKFWELLEAYLQACPSGSYTLRHLGRSMSKFVAGWDGLDEDRQRWFSAIAGIEYACMEIYEAAGREPLPPERIATEVLELQPHVRLMALPVPADDCFEWDAFSPQGESPVRLAVWRGPDGRARRVRLDAVEFVLLERLKEGRSLEALFADPVEPEPGPEDVQRWFSDWQSRGWITARGSEVIELTARPDEDWTGVDKMGSQARAMED
ncbi:DNA-binding domain-containing protein [Luteolibacter flavescens]|uniref:DNA-binding domain-containing protein n=1 Tax=Luteolibacter flavescens TaxID=1859460 RepID=A0ABT3FTV3_9BACT|nr:DNA-binding domain-containing protein [Luteolibacter flavescens]MCW1886988.1 DNA-binding domain-containing protein [Luteolibacter flavescens]